MFDPLAELFAPGRRHTEEELRRQALTREDPGDADPSRGPIDLTSGRVTIRAPARRRGTGTRWRTAGPVGRRGVQGSVQRGVSRRWRRWARAAASPRPATPSLARMLETWTLAVLGEMNSSSAI